MHPRLVQLVALAAAAGLLGLAATRMPAINAQRVVLNVRGAESALEAAPPEYAFAVQVLGAFRGLITDIAFVRAEMYKEQGRYYDAMQLASWICQLQPHFPSVWEFASWNMAWNISVTTFTPEERWNWVYNGVKLLRDRGIPLNPRAVNLYKQLAWTFNNKMGETTDDHHYAYKCNWAWRMHLVLGAPPNPLAEVSAEELARIADRMRSAADVDLLAQAGEATARQNEERRRKSAEARGLKYEPPARIDPDTGKPLAPGLSAAEIARDAAFQFLDTITQAPATLAELYERVPETRDLVARLRALGIPINDDELNEDVYWRPEGLAFTFFAPYQELRAPATTLSRVAARPRPTDAAAETQRRALDAALQVQANPPATEALVRFLQRKVLREVYKLDPEHMAYLIRTFGPIDWRAVDAQALYWTSRGLIAGGETLNDYLNDKTNTARILFFSLRNLFLFGRIVFEPLPERIHLSYLNRTVEPAFAEAMHQAFIRYGQLFDPNVERGEVLSTYRSGHVNFLTEMIRSLYLAGLEADAARYYRFLQDTYPRTPSGQPNPAFQKTLHEFVVDSFFESTDFPGQREMVLLLDSLFRSSMTELAAGNVSRFVQIVRRAQQFHEDYNRRQEDTPRLKLPAFVDMQTDAFGNFLAEPVPTPLLTLQKVQLWERAPLYLRQRVYDFIRPALAAECEYYALDVNKAFPEPPGMDEFRRSHPELYPATPEGTTPAPPGA